MSLDTVLGAVSLMLAGGDWWLARKGAIRRSWWPFWLLLAAAFAAYSVWAPFRR